LPDDRLPGDWGEGEQFVAGDAPRDDARGDDEGEHREIQRRNRVHARDVDESRDRRGERADEERRRLPAVEVDGVRAVADEQPHGRGDQRVDVRHEPVEDGAVVGLQRHERAEVDRLHALPHEVRGGVGEDECEHDDRRRGEHHPSAPREQVVVADVREDVREPEQRDGDVPEVLDAGEQHLGARRRHGEFGGVAQHPHPVATISGTATRSPRARVPD